MMRIWKKLLGCSMLLVCVLSGTSGVSAAEIMADVETAVNIETVVNTETTMNTDVEAMGGSFVFDEGGLLTDAERAELNAQILTLKEETGWDIFAVTTSYAEGKSSRDYADDFYDARTEEDSDGVLVLIDMDNREIYLSTSGDAIRYLTDERIESILDDGYYYVSEGAYVSCLSAMLAGVAECYEEGIYADQYNYDTETGAISRYRSITWMEAVPVLLLAAGAGLGTYFTVTKSYSIKGGRYEYPYMKYSKVDLTAHEDRFVNQTVVHHRIQTNTSSGGSGSSGGGHRSSTHHSSGGRSHGGGGRKF